MNSEKKKRPFNLRRFLFKALTWLGIGVFIGMITAGSGGMIPDSWIPFTIFGFIAFTFFWAIVFTRGLTSKIKKMTANGENIGGGNAQRVLARIEKLEEAGLVVNNFNHQFKFTLTVFPDMGEPYQTTIRQFITMGDLPNFYTGRFVAFIEDRDNPGYGVMEINPNEAWRDKVYDPSEKFKNVKAQKVYPNKGSSIFPTELGKVSGVRLAFGIVLSLAFLGLGFALPFVLSGNFDQLISDVRDLPKTLTGQNAGNFDDENLDKAYQKAIDYIGNRKVEKIMIYDKFTVLSVEAEGQKKAYDDVTLRGNSAEVHPNSSSSLVNPEELFTSDETSLPILKKVLAESLKKYDVKNLTYVGFRKQTKVSIEKNFEIDIDALAKDPTKVQEMITSKALKQRMIIFMYFKDPYNSTVLSFDGTTGEEIK